MILVTGGAGYVGSHFLKQHLARQGAEVVVVDDLSNGHKEALPSERAHFFRCSIGDQEALESIFAQFKIDAVVHFAAFAYVGESQEEPFKYFNNNFVESLRLFEMMERHGVRKLVFSSSCATYGSPQYVPIDEQHQQKPINVYGNTKLMVEQMLQSLAQTKNWSSVALRYFNAAGAASDGSIGESHAPETHLLPLVLQTALGNPPTVSINGDDYDTQDGTCIRDYIHVNDLARAHEQALDLLRESDCGAECINLGSEQGASVLEVIGLCREVTGRDVAVRVGPRRIGDPPKLIADAAKARRVLGWQPRSDLRSIVETAWKWEQNRKF